MCHECLMTLKSDAKFDKRLSLRTKIDMKIFLNFNANSGKSENLHFDVPHLLVACIKFQLRKYRRIISHDTEE